MPFQPGRPLREFFRTKDLLKEADIREELYHNAVVTGYISIRLQRAGFTQRLVSEYGDVERWWGRSWRYTGTESKKPILTKEEFDRLENILNWLTEREDLPDDPW